MRRILLTLVVAALAASGIAGCGKGDVDRDGQRGTPGRDDTATSYERDMRRIHRDMDAAMAAAFRSTALDPRLVREARAAATESASEMQATDPPARYEDAHAEYLAGLRTFQEILTDVARQVGDPDVARRHLGDKRFATGVAHLEKASTLYEDAGLELDGA